MKGEPEMTDQALIRENLALLRLIGLIHNNAAESPEWIRARIDETLARLAGERLEAEK
jgi:hypothetical protein